MRKFGWLIGVVVSGCFVPQSDLPLVSAGGGAGGGSPSAGGGAGGGFTAGSGAGMLGGGEISQLNQGLANCQIGESGNRPVTSAAQMKAELTGFWTLCSGSLLPLLTDEVGLEYTANGEWYRLVRDGTGVRRAQGAMATGTWSVISATQVNVDLTNSGTVIALPRFSATPQKLFMSNNGVYNGVWAGPTVTADNSSEPLNAADTAAFQQSQAACAISESGSRAVNTPAEMKAQMTGIWAQCSGSLLPPLTGEVGLEYRANGEWFRLVQDANGLKRMKTFMGGGKWVVISATQVNVELNAGGTVIASPKFAQTPHKVFMSNNGVYTGVWATAP